MDVPRHILCPIDLSELSALALRYADAFARCGGGRITAFYANAIELPPYFTESQMELLASQMRDANAAAEKSLARFVEETLGDSASRVTVKVAEATPVDGILHAVEDCGADMISMGTHGRTGVNRWMLGSVAERVLRQSRVPVLTARGSLAQQAAVHIRHILCPVNDSEAARKSLRLATRLAARLGASVTVLHVQEQDSRNSIGELCEWIAAQGTPQCPIREIRREGDAATQILTEATESACDLLVMGARHRLFLDTTVIGSTTVRTVRHARCPVLTVVDWPDSSQALPAENEERTARRNKE
jgi:nucleotide-binding universal stress UspA family protein